MKENKKLNPIIRIIPIVYEDLPDEERFLNICKEIVKLAGDHPLFNHYGVEVVLDNELSKYSPYLTKDIIPPNLLRYNHMNGWLTVDTGISSRLPLLKTNNELFEGSDLRFPKVDEGDILLAIVPLSIETTPAIWSTESHFGGGFSGFGSPNKIKKFIYHVCLKDDNGNVVDAFFKDFNIEREAHDIVSHVAEEHMGIKDVQMEMIKIDFGYSTKNEKPADNLFERLRVIFYGSDICSPLLLKKALLLFDDIHFHDRPGYMFDNWGLIGSPSRIRQYAYSFAKDGVPVLIHKPLNKWLGNNLNDTIAMEIEDPRFSKIFFEGFKNEPSFRNLFMQDNATYSTGKKGIEISSSMYKLDLGNKSYDMSKYIKAHKQVYDPDNEEGLRHTFAQSLMECSVLLSTSNMLSHENDLIPFTEYKTLQQLMELRYQRVVDQNPELQEIALKNKISFLSLRLLDLIIPAEQLEESSIEQVIEYRKRTRSLYEDFRKHLLRLNMKLEFDVFNEYSKNEIEKTLKTEVLPLAESYTKESLRIWEKMIGGMIKKAITSTSIVGVSSLIASCFIGASWLDLCVKGCGFTSLVVSHDLIDYALKTRNLKRQNSLSYLMKFKKG
jgi:hypothetical protein